MRNLPEIKRVQGTYNSLLSSIDSLFFLCLDFRSKTPTYDDHVIRSNLSDPQTSSSSSTTSASLHINWRRQLHQILFSEVTLVRIRTTNQCIEPWVEVATQCILFRSTPMRSWASIVYTTGATHLGGRKGPVTVNVTRRIRDFEA